MSRIEKQPVVIPEAVEVNIADAENLFTVKGPKGELSLDLINDISVSLLEDGAVKVSSDGKTRFSKAAAGTFRSLIQNMVIGVTEGYVKELELIGVGYRAKSQGKTLNLTLGFLILLTMKFQRELKYQHLLKLRSVFLEWTSKKLDKLQLNLEL